MIDANIDHVNELNQAGATICGKVTINNVHVNALLPTQMLGQYDLFIYMAKQYDNLACLSSMKEHAHSKTCVCCCQNGLPEETVLKYFSDEYVFGASIVWGATWLHPGCSELTTELELCYFVLGSVSGKESPALFEIKALLELMCRVELSDNLTGQRWTKLLLNATYSGMSTVIGGTFGQVNDDDLAVRWAVRIGRECVRVCKAKNIRMIPGHMSDGTSFDYMDTYDFQNDDQEVRCIYITKDIHQKDRSLVASMLQDIRNNRPCEVDQIVGVIISYGRIFDIPTPFSLAEYNIIVKKQNCEIPVNEFPKELYPQVTICDEQNLIF